MRWKPQDATVRQVLPQEPELSVSLQALSLLAHSAKQQVPQRWMSPQRELQRVPPE
jgi:hypothetical protein